MVWHKIACKEASAFKDKSKKDMLIVFSSIILSKNFPPASNEDIKKVVERYELLTLGYQTLS